MSIAGSKFPFADQLEGNQENHHHYRQAVVDFMEEHSDDFEPS